MVVSVIDIGTNTVLLLVAEVSSTGALTSLAEEQRIPRLGRGVDAQKTLHTDAMRRVVDVIQEYAEIVKRYTPDAVVVCGTSAVRDAHNRDELATMIQKGTGFTLEVLSGDEEALWTYRGAISGMPKMQHATVVDIGGGSTEVVVGASDTVIRRISLDIGSVRLTERLFRHDPPSHLELETAIELIEDQISRMADYPFAGTELVGVAGTATTLAALAQGLTTFSTRAVSNYRLSRDVIESQFRTLRAMPSGMIAGLSPVMEGRADIITAGILIVREIMAHCGFQQMTVSERGVRYGLALRAYETRIGAARDSSRH